MRKVCDDSAAAEFFIYKKSASVAQAPMCGQQNGQMRL
jgi:hypothetical protein